MQPSQRSGALCPGRLSAERFESRVEIQKKHVSLRRKTRLDPNEADGSTDGEDEAVASNVWPIKSSDGE